VFVALTARVAGVCRQRPCEAGVCVSRRLGKERGGLCRQHVSNDVPGIKGEYDLIKCLLTDSLANREAA